jgi:hypothetical protein
MTREAQIEAYRKRWEAGDFRAIVDAFDHFQTWGEPLPDWAVGPVLYALQLAFASGGAPGKGKTGGFAKQAERHDRDWWRYAMASTCKSVSDENLEPARAALAGTPAQGSTSAIRASYHRVRKQSQKRPN